MPTSVVREQWSSRTPCGMSSDKFEFSKDRSKVLTISIECNAKLTKLLYV